MYRALDRDGAVLYIGMTRKLTERGKQHRRHSVWFPEMERYILRGPYLSEDYARFVEQSLIAELRPIHNVARPTPRLREPWPVKERAIA